MSYAKRVAERAAALDPVRLLLTVASLPFYLVGLLIGVVWVVFAWAWSALVVGVDDVRARPATDDEGG